MRLVYLFCALFVLLSANAQARAPDYKKKYCDSKEFVDNSGTEVTKQPSLPYLHCYEDKIYYEYLSGNKKFILIIDKKKFPPTAISPTMPSACISAITRDNAAKLFKLMEKICIGEFVTNPNPGPDLCQCCSSGELKDNDPFEYEP